VPQSDPHHPPRLTRRATIGSALAFTGLASTSLAGCEWGPPDQVNAPEAKQDTDQTLASNMAIAIGQRAAIVEATVAAHTELTAALQPFTTMHAAHFAALGGTARTLETGVVSPNAAIALRDLRATEAQLQKGLVAAATQATSGQLARTLASMAASVAQQLAVLPVRPATTGAIG
jgi:hypothetical protein